MSDETTNETAVETVNETTNETAVETVNETTDEAKVETKVEAKTEAKVETTDEARTNPRKVREGIVVSDKMDSTLVVAVKERVRHARYGKTVQRTKKLY